jgi:hypothetical protein
MNSEFLVLFSVLLATALSFVVGYVWGTIKTNKKFDKYLAVFDKEIMGYISRDPKELLLEERDSGTADVVDFLKYKAMRELHDGEDDDF